MDIWVRDIRSVGDGSCSLIRVSLSASPLRASAQQEGAYCTHIALVMPHVAVLIRFDSSAEYSYLVMPGACQ